MVKSQDKEIKKLAFKNELTEKVILKYEHVQNEITKTRQENESLLQERIRLLREIEKKNYLLEECEIKVCIFSMKFLFT